MGNVHSTEDTAVTPARWLIFLGKTFKAFGMGVIASSLRELLPPVEQSGLWPSAASPPFENRQNPEVRMKHLHRRGLNL